MTETPRTDTAPMSPILSREELMRYSKRDLVDTVRSHIPHLDLLRQERTRAEMAALAYRSRLLEMADVLRDAAIELHGIQHLGEFADCENRACVIRRALIAESGDGQDG